MTVDKRIYRWLGFYIFVVLCLVGMPSSIAHAEVVTGEAVIENGNLPKAKELARQDAMRLFVESKVGVYVKSVSESRENMLIRDTVLTNSEGYVLINGIVKEWQDGDLYFIQLNLTANEQKIQTIATDLKNRLQNLDDNSNRQGIQVAIVGQDAAGRAKDESKLNQYLQYKLELVGFKVVVNDAVNDYLFTHYNDAEAGLEARRIARINRDEGNALVRGSLSTIEIKNLSGGYKAVVNASFELVGLDSNEVNTFSKYFTAAAPTAQMAEYRANELAVQEAAESLGQKALETVQNEQQGGVKHIKIMARFDGISDRIGQRQLIMDGIEASNCRVIRTSFTAAGQFQVFIVTESYNSIVDLQNAILQNISGLKQGNSKEEELGVTRLDFIF